MAVAHDGTSNVSASCSGVTSQSVSKTTTGSDRCATIHIGTAPQTADITGVTYGGVAATEVITLNGGATTEELAALYRYLAPATGSTTVQVTWDEAAYGAIGVASYTGVDQTTPTSGPTSTNAAGTSTGSSLNVTSSTGDMVVDTIKVYLGGSSPSVGTGQTQTVNAQDGSFGEYCAASYEAGAGTVTMSWTWSSISGHYTHVAANLKQATSTDPTDGSSSGQGTATATGQASVTADGSSAGQGAATGEATASVTTDGSAAGAGTATAEATAAVTAEMNGAGQGTATAEGTTGGSTVTADGYSAGTSDGVAVGQASVSAEMNGAGAATATAEGTSGASVEGAGYSRGNSPFAVLEWTAEGTATGYNVGYSQTSGSGNYTVVDVGNVTTYTLGPLAGGTWYYAVQSYDGGGTGSWSTEATFYISTIAVAAGQATVTTDGSSAGQGTATGVGQATVSAEMNGAGQATATVESQSSDSMAGYSAGTSDGQAVGATIVSAEMNGAGSAIATAESNAGQLVEAAGFSDGTASATAEGAATITAAGSSSGMAIGTAVGTTAEAQATTRHEGRRPRRKNDDAEMQWLVEKLTAYIVNGSYGDIVYSEE